MTWFGFRVMQDDSGGAADQYEDEDQNHQLTHHAHIPLAGVVISD